MMRSCLNTVATDAPKRNPSSNGNNMNFCCNKECVQKQLSKNFNTVTAEFKGEKWSATPGGIGKSFLVKSNGVLDGLIEQQKEKESEKKLLKKKNQNDISNKKYSSTLSLHIVAYENSVKASEYELPQSSSPSPLPSNLPPTSSNSFEFPRQQKDDSTKPGIMQFRASQQLFKPNQSPAKAEPAVIEPVDTLHPSESASSCNQPQQLYPQQQQQLQQLSPCSSNLFSEEMREKVIKLQWAMNHRDHEKVFCLINDIADATHEFQYLSRNDSRFLIDSIVRIFATFDEDADKTLILKCLHILSKSKCHDRDFTQNQILKYRKYFYKIAVLAKTDEIAMNMMQLFQSLAKGKYDLYYDKLMLKTEYLINRREELHENKTASAETTTISTTAAATTTNTATISTTAAATTTNTATISTAAAAASSYSNAETAASQKFEEAWQSGRIHDRRHKRGHPAKSMINNGSSTSSPLIKKPTVSFQKDHGRPVEEDQVDHVFGDQPMQYQVETDFGNLSFAESDKQQQPPQQQLGYPPTSSSSLEQQLDQQSQSREHNDTLSSPQQHHHQSFNSQQAPISCAPTIFPIVVGLSDKLIPSLLLYKPQNENCIYEFEKTKYEGRVKCTSCKSRTYGYEGSCFLDDPTLGHAFDCSSTANGKIQREHHFRIWRSKLAGQKFDVEDAVDKYQKEFGRYFALETKKPNRRVKDAFKKMKRKMPGEIPYENYDEFLTHLASHDHKQDSIEEVQSEKENEAMDPKFDDSDSMLEVYEEIIVQSSARQRIDPSYKPIKIQDRHQKTMKAKIYDCYMPVAPNGKPAYRFRPPSLQELQQALLVLNLPVDLALNSPLLTSSASAIEIDGKSPVTFETNGDGNCGPRSVSMLLTGSESCHWQIRSKIYEHIHAHAQNIYGIGDQESATRSHSKLQKMKAMKPQAVGRRYWFGNDEFFALSDLLKWNVHVFDFRSGVSSCYNVKESDNEPTIYLLFLNGNHYEPIAKFVISDNL